MIKGLNSTCGLLFDMADDTIETDHLDTISGIVTPSIGALRTRTGYDHASAKRV